MGRFSGKRIFLLGDSLSDGTEGRTRQARGTTPGERLAADLLARGAASVRIDARGGRSAVSLFTNSREVPSGADILKDEILVQRPDFVILFLGTNDILRDPVATKKAMVAIVSAALTVGAQVIHIGPPLFPHDRVVRRYGDPPDLRRLNDLAAAFIHGLYQQLPTQFLDARLLTTDLLTVAEGRAGDQIHFAAKGAKLFGARLAAALDPPGAAATPGGGVTGGAWLTVGAAALTGAAAVALVWWVGRP